MADPPFPTYSDDPNSWTSPETGDIAPVGQPPWLERGPRLEFTMGGGGGTRQRLRPRPSDCGLPPAVQAQAARRRPAIRWWPHPGGCGLSWPALHWQRLVLAAPAATAWPWSALCYWQLALVAPTGPCTSGQLAMELLTAADARGWRGGRRRLAGHRWLAAKQKAPTAAGRWLGD